MSTQKKKKKTNLFLTTLRVCICVCRHTHIHIHTHTKYLLVFHFVTYLVRWQYSTSFWTLKGDKMTVKSVYAKRQDIYIDAKLITEKCAFKRWNVQEVNNIKAAKNKQNKKNTINWVVDIFRVWGYLKLVIIYNQESEKGNQCTLIQHRI